MNLGLRLKVQWWIIALFTSLLAIIMTIDGTTSRIENLIYDHLLRYEERAPATNIVLVAIDDDSLAHLGRWPWSRDVHATLISQIGKAKARAIGYDVLFTEPSQAPQDARLGRAIAEGSPFFTPLSLNIPGADGSAADVLYPILPIRRAATNSGFTNIDVDPDGVVRSAPLSIGSGRLPPNLMEVMHRWADPDATPQSKPMRIPFSGRGGSWPSVSAAAVIAGEVPAEFLRGKFVLVGVTAQGLGSRYPVPVGGVMPGLEIEAHLLQAVLGHRMIRLAELPACLLFSIVPLWLLMLALGPIHRFSPFLCFVFLVLAILVGNGIALIVFRTWLPPGAALAALCVAYPLWGWWQLAATHQFIHRELKRHEAEPGLFLNSQLKSGPTSLSSTLTMFKTAIDHSRDMRHFVTDRLDQLPDTTLVTDMHGSILLANATAKKLFGIETTANIATFLQRFQLAGTHSPVTFSAGTETATSSLEAITKDGRYFAIRFVPQRSVNGSDIGWIIQAMDISEAKAAQRQRDDFMQLVTHDMRSPQASIIAVLDTSSSEDITPDVEQRIRQYAENTIGLTDRFTQLARAETINYVIEEIALGDILTDAIDDLWPQITAKGMSVDTYGDKEHLFVKGDRSLLTRAMINVLGNAVKYCDPGSHIRCTLGRQTAPTGTIHATCAISDDGPGLPSDQQLKIFERFHRSRPGTGTEVSGVGLGLSFVHTVVVRHGGEIKCESELGCGATFTFLLPLAD